MVFFQKKLMHNDHFLSNSLGLIIYQILRWDLNLSPFACYMLNTNFTMKLPHKSVCCVLLIGIPFD